MTAAPPAEPPEPPIAERPSPNHGARRPDDAGSVRVDMLVLHYTDMPDAESALARMCDPDASVSAHYLIAEDGAVTRLVPEDRRAWHAGLAHWRGVADVNSRSVGIELQNPGHSHGYREFPAAQIAALVALARGVLSRHPVPARNVLGHSDVAPDRKIDPGELFPWRDLAAAGVGLWPEPAADAGAAGGAGADADVSQTLAAIGYDPAARRAVAAFQRRFRPARIDNAADAETAALARAYLALCEACPDPAPPESKGGPPP